MLSVQFILGSDVSQYQFQLFDPGKIMEAAEELKHNQIEPAILLIRSGDELVSEVVCWEGAIEAGNANRMLYSREMAIRAHDLNAARFIYMRMVSALEQDAEQRGVFMVLHCSDALSNDSVIAGRLHALGYSANGPDDRGTICWHRQWRERFIMPD